VQAIPSETSTIGEHVPIFDVSTLRAEHRQVPDPFNSDDLEGHIKEQDLVLGHAVFRWECAIQIA
jgi:hypothetical protein